MATIGNLFIKVVAVIDDFINPMNKVQQRMSSVHKMSLSLAQGVMHLVDGLLAAARQVFILTKNYTEQAMELAKLAIQYGVSIEVIGMLQMACSRLGISFGQMHSFLNRFAVAVGALLAHGEGIRHFKDMVGKKSGGGLDAMEIERAVRAFGELGIAAADLAGKSLDEQFRIVLKRIGELPTAAERAAAAFKLFGRAAADILPLIAAGPDFLDRMNQKAKEFGFGDLNIGVIQQANEAFQDMTDMVKLLGMHLAIEIAPLVMAIAAGILQWVEGAGGFSEVAQNIVGFFVYVIGLIMDWGHALGMIFDALMAGVKGIMAIILKGIEAAIRALEAVTPAMIGGRELRVAADVVANTIGDMADNMADKANDSAQSFWRGAENWPKDALNQWWEDAKQKARIGGRQMQEELNKVKPGANLAEMKRVFDLFQKGEETIRRMRTPIEVMKDELASLNAQWDVGALDADNYGRAAAAAVAEASKKLNIGQSKLFGAAEIGTTQAVSAIVRAQVQDRDAGKTPQERLEAILRESEALQRIQAEYQRQMVGALQDAARQGKI